LNTPLPMNGMVLPPPSASASIEPGPRNCSI
jgi:hypothetical protein